ncbi:MAG: hypothetical protein B6D58_01165 [candidate division Zixibacteria bacterium 4484_95]|nr:MAG: hypothetical protein B6D58_01165 [candidate division Zixibacteria bacterium 4484_95]
MKTKISILTALFIILALVLVQTSSAQMAEVKVGKGTLKMGGILQAGYTFHLEDDEGYNSFTLNRARFLFWGDIIPDKVKYFVQLDHKGNVSVLDYKARFFYISNTEITVGRFLPNFTLYMPYSTAKLEMINYPLTTQRFAVWRQVGIQTTTKTEYVDFNLGIFNGADQPNNTSDNNDAKDFLLRANIKPPIEQAKVLFGGYAWIGSADPGFGLTEEGTVKRNRFGGFAKVDYKATEDVTVKFRGEFLMASTEHLTFADMDSVACIDAQAFFAHVGIQPTPKVEVLFRYDFHDPDTDTDDDGESWITAGVNYYLESINSMFYLNYISKIEQGTDVDNDLIVAQVQIAF